MRELRRETSRSEHRIGPDAQMVAHSDRHPFCSGAYSQISVKEEV
jgi:hypothetical protein